MRIVSRCLWDTHSDSSASEFYENESMYCVCQVMTAKLYPLSISNRIMTPMHFVNVYL